MDFVSFRAVTFRDCIAELYEDIREYKHLVRFLFQIMLIHNYMHWLYWTSGSTYFLQTAFPHHAHYIFSHSVS